ncbi:MAG: long-chain-fatty-acid--CoA ligase [Stigonema ocellatum SAG 48.90 = DSM 106950]|nr:long-chain-fatty-acid--CoA ligase [Stigonema ocellatum SAG 48.90 = DSM 106950]
MNIVQNVERGSCLFPNKPALIFEGKYFTYKDLNEMANRVANGLRGLGIEHGERVALFLPNIPEFVISYLGIQKIGAIAVSVNTSLKSDELKFILDDCCAAVLITTETLCENVHKQDLPHLKHILIAEGNAVEGITLGELMANASSSARAVEMKGDDPAAILYTSGTTGFPKGATLSHGNVISNMYSMNRCCGMRPNDKILLFLPMFHCFGQNAILNSALNICATIVLHRSFEPETVLTSVVDHNITIFFGVPTTFILLLDRASTRDLSSRYYFSAAAGLPVEIARRWQEKFGEAINQGYGLTETSPLASYNHHLKYKLGSIGSPIENVEMKIVNLDDGYEVAPGDIGEIVIRGSNVMLGYWNRPSETAKVIRDGWFHTGDIGQMDDLGYFYIVDRLKDMINTGGLKVYPAEVENVIYQHPSVAEVAVYGLPDVLMGEQVKASVVLKPDQMVAEEEIIAFCHQRIAKFKVPSAVEFVTSIPKNPTGKVLKRLLRQENSGSRLSQTWQPTQTKQSESLNISTETAESIENWIMDWLVRKLTVEAKLIDPSKSFADYGLDSVRAVKLAQDLSDWLGYSLEETIVWNFSTIESLARHLGSQQILPPTAQKDEEYIRQQPEATVASVALVNKQVGNKNLSNKIRFGVSPDSSREEFGKLADLTVFSDAEIAELLAQEIATVKHRKLI